MSCFQQSTVYTEMNKLTITSDLVPYASVQCSVTTDARFSKPCDLALRLASIWERKSAANSLVLHATCQVLITVCIGTFYNISGSQEDRNRRREPATRSRDDDSIYYGLLAQSHYGHGAPAVGYSGFTPQSHSGRPQATQSATVLRRQWAGHAPASVIPM